MFLMFRLDDLIKNMNFRIPEDQLLDKYLCSIKFLMFDNIKAEISFKLKVS